MGPGPSSGVPITIARSRSAAPRSTVCSEITSPLAAVTPGVPARSETTASSIAATDVNGPDTPSLTTQPSAWALSTVRSTSLRKPLTIPVSSRARANTRPAPTTAIRNWR